MYSNLVNIFGNSCGFIDIDQINILLPRMKVKIDNKNKPQHDKEHHTGAMKVIHSACSTISLSMSS
jgi:hypothetical protein